MKKPLIALTPQYDGDSHHTWMRNEYTNSIIKSGGIPVILEQFDHEELLGELLDHFDGVLFTGGADVHPKYYGEEVLPECGGITEARDIFEIPLYREASKRGMPILGICRGIQLMNVAAGGTLHQHKPAHMGVKHIVHVHRDTPLFEIFGEEEFESNSWHHQAVKVPAPNMIEGVYSDVEESGRLTEAICDPNAPYFNVGIQWHPENLYDESIYSRRLFDAYVAACAKYMKENK